MPTPLPVKQTVRHFDMIGWAYQQTDGTPAHRHVLLVLAIAANEQGMAYPKVATLVERTGLGRSTVLEALSHWKTVGVLTTAPRTYPNQRKVMANEYHLNPTRFPFEVFEEEVIDTRPGAGPVQVADVTRPVAGPPIGIANEYPEEQLHVRTAPRPRRKGKKSSDEDQLRGGWHTEDEAPEDPTPVDMSDPTIPNGKFIEGLIVHYRIRARLLEPISVTNKDAMAGYFMTVLKGGTDRQVLLEAVNSFFDQQIYDTSKGALWKQLLDALPRMAAKKAVRAAEAEADYSSGGARRRRQA